MTADPAAKATLRQHFRQRREANSVNSLAEWSRTIRERIVELPAVAAARTVFCFVSVGPEVDTRPLIDLFRAEGRTVLVPCIVNRTTMIACEFRGWEALMPGRLGIPTPDPAGAVAWAGDVDAVVTPGLAFTLAGDRLGYGAGFYDRWFAAHPPARRVAVAYECQIAAALPTSERDIPVEWLVTEARSVPTGRR